MKQKEATKKFITRQNLLGFLVGGGVYFWSSWLIITFGEKYLGLWWINIIGNLVGISLNYLCQRYLAFPGHNLFNAGWRYAAITAINLLIGYFILKWLTDTGVDLWFAQFISAVFFTVWNYAWYKLWVFKSGDK